MFGMDFFFPISWLVCHEKVPFRDLKTSISWQERHEVLIFRDMNVTKYSFFVTGTSWNPHFSWQEHHEILIFRDREVTKCVAINRTHDLATLISFGPHKFPSRLLNELFWEDYQRY